MKFVLVILFLTFFMSIVVAQEPGPPTARERPRPQHEESPEQDLPAEMRARLEIERMDNTHKKILEDAERLETTATQVAKHFQEAGRMSSEDMKDLSTIEKLAKRILDFAGGSEEKIEDLKPASVSDMLNQLSTLSAKVHGILKTEPRQVVSAVLIADSNTAIQLAQYIKKSVK